MQFQLLVSDFEWTDFVVWTPTGLIDFAEQNLERLKNFYFDHLLPALYAETAQCTYVGHFTWNILCIQLIVH